MVQRVLVFPGGMPRSLVEAEQLASKGHVVIGASSLEFDVARHHYEEWRYLPFITSAQFDEKLRELLVELEVDSVYTPNLVVWNYLSTNLRRIAPHVVLANQSPVDEALAGYRKTQQKAESFEKRAFEIGGMPEGASRLNNAQLASLTRYLDLIPGMCDDDKVQALLEVSRFAVEGDVVEIGTWWGKSAFVLARLARLYRLGALLCIDPWDDQHLVQDEKVVDSGSASISANEAFDVFVMGLLPFSNGDINYLKKTSVDASSLYSCEKVVVTPEFGNTHYSGRISILHIDGNHAYEAVRSDVLAWSKFVCEGDGLFLMITFGHMEMGQSK